MKLVLSDNGFHQQFAPLTLTRPTGDLRMGIFTNSERWNYVSGAEIYFDTASYLQGKFPNTSTCDLKVNALLIPSREMMEVILALPDDTTLLFDGVELASKGSGETRINWLGDNPMILENRWHLYQFNDRALKQDFEIITEGRTSQKIAKTNTIIGNPELIFLEKGAIVEAAILNTNDGPIYVGKDAEIMEGSIVRGGLAMCEKSTLKLGTKIYGAVTLGPHCKVGGELNNSIFQAYSNKGHDGFVGNSLIGEWCNLGADTNTSNLKNNYGKVTTYSYKHGSEVKTDVQFMGVTMGDHSKCGINTMFNTATVIGVSCNVFGGDFPAKFIPSFSWGGVELTEFIFDKAIEYANNMMARRNLQLTDAELAILKKIQESK